MADESGDSLDHLSPEETRGLLVMLLDRLGGDVRFTDADMEKGMGLTHLRSRVEITKYDPPFPTAARVRLRGPVRTVAGEVV